MKHERIEVSRIKGIIKDIIWIGIKRHDSNKSVSPVKHLINFICTIGIDVLVSRILSKSDVFTIGPGLSLHWFHHTVNGETVISFTLSGDGVDVTDYSKFVTRTMAYFGHLDRTGSRTF